MTTRDDSEEVKHKTTHIAEPENGKVYVYCETCTWSTWVQVEGLSYIDAWNAICAARDEHEANPEKK